MLEPLQTGLAEPDGRCFDADVQSLCLEAALVGTAALDRNFNGARLVLFGMTDHLWDNKYPFLNQC